MNRKFEKTISLILVMVMLVGLFPGFVWAGVTTNVIDSDVTEKGLSDQAVDLIDEIENIENLSLPKTEQTISAQSALATTAIEGDYEYADIDGGVSIVKYNGPGGNLVIPATLGGKKVVELGCFSFANTGITSVTISEGIKNINSSAFNNCRSLTNVSLPESIISIDSAFDSCSSLTEIFIPRNVSYLNRWTFVYCSNLTTITVDADNEYYTSIDGALYDKGVTTFLKCPEGKAYLKIEDSVTQIESASFAFSKKLEQIIIPEGVTFIGDGAFESCNNLKTVSIPETATSIGTRAFFDCSSLTEVDLPKEITSINDGIFFGCSSLTSISIPEKVTSIGTQAFRYCTNLTTVQLPDNITVIGDDAFNYCSSLTSISLPEKLMRIEAFAFWCCSSLTHIEIPQNTTNIERFAFDGCVKLKEIVFKSFLTETSTENINGSYTIPRSTTIIGDVPSKAQDYAAQMGNRFIPIASAALLVNIKVTSPAKKAVYNIGEALDLSGLAVTGMYSDGSSKVENITIDNISGFDSTKPIKNQTVTITINGKTTAYAVEIKDSDAWCNCSYRTHIAYNGWQNWRNNGAMSGTSGLSLRLEGIEVKLNTKGYDLGIEYSTHVQNYGWQGFRSNGAMSGTTEEGLRLEAIKIKLTGTDADKFDVYYQVHAQNVGWMDWAKNGAQSGTAGFGYRLEGIKIVIIPKGNPAPGITDRPFLENK